MLKYFKSFFWIFLFYNFLFILLLFAFTKFLLPEGYIIAGHDSGLALDSKTFLETRLFAWDERINFGEDNSLLFGSLTIHAFDYFFSFFSNTSYAGNQLNLFFWFSMIFTAASLFGYQLKDRLGKTFAFILPPLILFNFYIFQSVFILERAKYSLVASSLIFLAIIVRVFERKTNILIASIISSLTFSVFNGGSWLGLPLFGGLLIILIIFLTFLLIGDIKTRTFQRSLEFLVLLFLTGFFFLLLNSYSLFPYIQTFYERDYQIIQNTLTLQANRAWLDYISQGSSFLNIFRLQGVPDWYVTKFTSSLAHPYAKFYTENSFFVALSYLIPIIAFSSLILVKTSEQKRIILIMILISLTSMIFMSGTRSPLGFVYEFLFDRLPGFVIFRSSFYKFGYAFIITYSVLLSFTFASLIDYFASKIKFSFSKKITQVVLVFLVVILWFFYHFKIFSPNIFNWRTDFTTRIKIPAYVNEYKNYAQKENIDSNRVLILPPFNESWLSDGYDFGYWSLSTIHYSLTKQAVLANTQNSYFSNGNWVVSLYESLRQKDVEAILEITARLGVNRFLLKTDALVEEWSGGEDPKIYQDILESLDFIQKEKEFGKWILYSIKRPPLPLIVAENDLIELTNNSVSEIKPFLNNKKTYIKNKDSIENNINDFVSQKIEHFKCKSCLIEDSVTVYQLIWPRLLPNSLLFPLKVMNEDLKLKNIVNEGEKVNSYFGLITKRTAEIDAMFYYKIPDAYIIHNLALIQGYLDEVITYTKKTRDPYEDFEAAKKTLDNIQSVELKLTEQLSSDKAGIRSEIVKDEIAKTLWKIYELKEFYAPIINNLDKWESEKIFEIKVPSKSYQLYLNENSLPTDNNSKEGFGIPKLVINSEEYQIDPDIPRSQNWILLPSDKLKIGDNEIILKFENPKNLLIIEDNLTVETPEGRRRCYRGRINSSTTKKAYLIKIKTYGDTLRIFSKVDTFDELKQFLEWKNEIKVEGFFDENYYRGLYTPIAKVDKFQFYICGEHQDLPSYKEFIVQEVYEPEIIGIEKFSKGTSSLPIVTYKRIDPTRFDVKIEKISRPFILVMNQRYSPLWIVKNKETNQDLKLTSFPVDLYANGWVINSQEDLELSIEYKPQNYFYLGIGVSLITLIILICFSGIYFARKVKL